MEKDIHANTNQKKMGVAALIPDKVDFRAKTTTRDKEGHFIIKESVHWEDVTVLSVYAPNH